MNIVEQPPTATLTDASHITPLARRTAAIPPRPTHTPTRLPTHTPGPTTTALPGSPLDYKTISQGHVGLFTPPEERWPDLPTFSVFNSAEEWEQFVADYGLGAENEDTVYIRVGWEDVSDTYLMAEGRWHILASILRPQGSLGQKFKFVFVSQWPPFDGTAEETMTIERTLTRIYDTRREQ